MRKALPARPNLEHLKSQAKDLLDALRRNEREALDRFRDALPGARGVDDAALAAMNLALHDAQSVLAREYGFASWAALRAHVEDAVVRAETLRALMEPHLSAPLPDEVQQAMLAAMSGEGASSEEVSLSSQLPLLPLRNAVLAVGAVAPLHLGRPSSVAAVEAARDSGKTLAVFSQKDAANEDPGEADFHPVGCAVRLLSSTPFTPDQGMWIVVRATRWIRLEAIERREPWPLCRIAAFTVEEEESAEVKRIEQTLRERVRTFAARLPDPERMLRRLESMTALQLADATMVNLPCPVQDKARYASEPRLLARLEYVLALCDRAA
jgi:Lon protease-like protein